MKEGGQKPLSVREEGKKTPTTYMIRDALKQIMREVAPPSCSCGLEIGFRTASGPTETTRAWLQGLKLAGLQPETVTNYWSPASPYGVIDIWLRCARPAKNVEPKISHLAVFWHLGSKSEILYWKRVENVEIEDAIESVSSTCIMSSVIRLLSEKY